MSENLQFEGNDVSNANTNSLHSETDDEISVGDNHSQLSHTAQPQMLEIILAKLNEIANKLCAIERFLYRDSINSNVAAEIVDGTPPRLPIKTKADFDKLEKDLETDGMKQRLVSILFV